MMDSMTMNEPEELLFAIEERDSSSKVPLVSDERPWNVLVVDDEEDVHAVTKLVLDQFEFNGRGINLLHAYSGLEALKIVEEYKESIALIFLDVVMETDDAGLRLVETIRRVLKNRIVRIVLRTGQPGQAPERRVIRDYDINDYKSKTELTASKLYTTTLTALRSFEDIIAVETSRRGLEKILMGAGSLFQLRSMELFASGVLTQMSALLGIGREGILCVTQGGIGAERREDLYVFASSGEFERINGALLDNSLDEEVAKAIVHSMRSRKSRFDAEGTTLYFETPSGRKCVVFLQTRRAVAELERKLVEVFCRQVSIGMDNLHMYEDLRQTHEELKLAHVATVVTLADVAELRDPETGSHVLRVARMSENIARVLQESSEYSFFIDEAFIEGIGLASIMHDVGKVTTPDQILHKPGPLSHEERTVMQSHAETGKLILSKAREIAQASKYLQLGAEIAGWHHEWWDGSGYPDGLAGMLIPLSARIVAVADVFDALTHARVYKAAWDREEAIAYIEGRSGTQFDPVVVTAFSQVVRDPAIVWASI